jgi:hypothetical protein
VCGRVKVHFKIFLKRKMESIRIIQELVDASCKGCTR